GVDVIGAKGQSHQVQEFKKQTGDVAFWNPYIFGGMPIYFRFAAQIPSIDSVVKYLGELLNAVFLWYLVGAIGMFFCLRYFGLSHITALFGALIFILFPHYKSLWVEGHFMKFRAVMIVPWVTLSAVNFFDKRTLFGAALLALAWGNQIRTQHSQIVFYTAWLIFAIGILPMLRELFEKKWQKFLRSFLFLALGLGFAVLMAAQPLFLAKEYLPYSARGAYTNNINEQIKSNTENQKQGMTFEKAMQWSTHPSELATWVVPRFLGGMSSEVYKGDQYPHLQGQALPGYWGKMPFTQSSEYFGGLVLFMALIGIYFYRKKVLFLSLSSLAIFYNQWTTNKGVLFKLFWCWFGWYGVVTGNALADILSYLRLFALGLTTGLLASAINEIFSLISEIPYVGLLLVIVLFVPAHLFNIAMNAFGGYVHTSRLQYLEFFMKFFQGGGEEFRPFAEERRYTVIR
ncbi:hypothetical protein KA005_13430, partial [bacterium]|nr:hypothetical protein [bacterium]